MKKKIKLLLTLIVGFAVAMLIMGIFIYFGYVKAYETGVELFTVKILGLPVYQLIKTGDSYVGENMGIYMGIFCGVCMIVAVIIGELWKAGRKHMRGGRL